jgi:hypothetical protein
MVKLKAWPCIGGFGDLVIPLIVGTPVLTVRDLPLDVRPVELFLTVTVKLPADNIACPDTWVLEPVALMLQGVLHPGPLKKIVELDPLKLDPLSVIVNACPVIGGFGDVVTELMAGVNGTFPMFNVAAFEGLPVLPLRACTENEPAASTAAPLS